MTTASFFPSPLPLERTLAVIKPGVARVHGEAIVAELQRHGFTTLAEGRFVLSPAQVRVLYADLATKPFFDTLVAHMTSDDVIALALEKPGAIR